MPPPSPVPHALPNPPLDWARAACTPSAPTNLPIDWTPAPPLPSPARRAPVADPPLLPASIASPTRAHIHAALSETIAAPPLASIPTPSSLLKGDAISRDAISISREPDSLNLKPHHAPFASPRHAFSSATTPPPASTAPSASAQLQHLMDALTQPQPSPLAGRAEGAHHSPLPEQSPASTPSPSSGGRDAIEAAERILARVKRTDRLAMPPPPPRLPTASSVAVEAPPTPTPMASGLASPVKALSAYLQLDQSHVGGGEPRERGSPPAVASDPRAAPLPSHQGARQQGVAKAPPMELQANGDEVGLAEQRDTLAGGPPSVPPPSHAPSVPPPLQTLPESPFSRVEHNLRQLHQRLHRTETGARAPGGGA